MRAIALQTEIGVFTAFPIIFRMRTVKYLNSGENASILFSGCAAGLGILCWRFHLGEGGICLPRLLLAKMDYSLLKDVTQESHRWRVRVRATLFSEFTTANEPDKILRLDLVLLDEQGDMMDAQIPGRRVDQFKPLLKEGAVYYIKYFEVAEARP